jgi:multicomponent K+:H+ antiporter subunit G
MSSAADGLLTLPLWAELLAAALLVVGAGFALVGSWALAKWRDPLRRLHGPSKATTLGVGCVLIASAGTFALLGQPSLHEFLISLFLFITAPVSAYLVVQSLLKMDAHLRPTAPPAPTDAAHPGAGASDGTPG